MNANGVPVPPDRAQAARDVAAALVSAAATSRAARTRSGGTGTPFAFMLGKITALPLVAWRNQTLI